MLVSDRNIHQLSIQNRGEIKPLSLICYTLLHNGSIYMTEHDTATKRRWLILNKFRKAKMKISNISV